MPEIRAAYRRTFQVKPYETETVELSVGADAQAVNPSDLAGKARALYEALAEVGDAVVLDRIGKSPRSRPSSTPAAKDPWS